MDRKEICNLWIEYLKESKFREVNGEAAYLAYVDRINAVCQTRRVTPFPTVRKISDIIGSLIDQAHSETITDGDPSFDNFKEKLIRDVKAIEQTSLLLHIHCPGIPPRGGQEAVLKEVRKMLNAKLKDVEAVREFYLTWTEPGEKVVPELAMYLELYKGKTHHKLGMTRLQRIALSFAEKIGSKRMSKEEDGYFEESQIRRSIGFAKQILRNVENGSFPGDYKTIV